jgi:hypothetical protein
MGIREGLNHMKHLRTAALALVALSAVLGPGQAMAGHKPNKHIHWMPRHQEPRRVCKKTGSGRYTHYVCHTKMVWVWH